MKLTLRQATLIRDDYEHIEGEDVQLDGSSFIINSLLIAPFDEKLRSQFLSDFYDKYFGNVDDISLAESLSPKFYTVLALCHYKGSGTCPSMVLKFNNPYPSILITNPTPNSADMSC